MWFGNSVSFYLHTWKAVAQNTGNDFNKLRLHTSRFEYDIWHFKESIRFADRLKIERHKPSLYQSSKSIIH
jgi:hypothetical protein